MGISIRLDNHRYPSCPGTWLAVGITPARHRPELLDLVVASASVTLLVSSGCMDNPSDLVSVYTTATPPAGHYHPGSADRRSLASKWVLCWRLSTQPRHILPIAVLGFSTPYLRSSNLRRTYNNLPRRPNIWRHTNPPDRYAAG